MPDITSRIDSGRRSHGCVACLIAIAFVVAAIVGIAFLNAQNRLRIERRELERRQEDFNEVKNGSKRVIVRDSLLLPMLAKDTECVSNLEELGFFMVEISPDDAKYVAKLTNVKVMDFYDTQGVDEILEESLELPVETLSFDTVRLRDELLRQMSRFPNLREVNALDMLSPEQAALLKSLRPDIEVNWSYSEENQSEGAIRIGPKGESESE